MTIKKWLFLIGLLCILSSCGNESALEPSNKANEKLDLTHISTKNNDTSQHPANQAKDALSKYKEITEVKAVNTTKQLIIAVQVEQNKRFNLTSIRKQLQKEMKKKFPDHKVELTTDKKIVIELKKLEEKLQSESISKKKVEKRVKEIIKLSKEQT
ncbi:YhcN/YlaJ family sporulation lipoprotein [Oceanobacillus manasiensis]|uniref:YhcN/YlaJ family sporulation lipoprotein n=1 Tax=Oceanobacillus manasiensis TaxID=586413 RepID=UPI0005A89E3A|nr:YhcN/YlaJ family sporulation lipoprotein [Oceanobacillus manasiensis]